MKSSKLTSTTAIATTTFAILVGSAFLTNQALADNDSDACCNSIIKELQSFKQSVQKNFLLLFNQVNKIVATDFDFKNETLGHAALKTMNDSNVVSQLSSDATSNTTNLALVRDSGNYQQIVDGMIAATPKSSEDKITPEQSATFNIGSIMDKNVLRSKEDMEAAQALLNNLSAVGNLPQLLDDNFKNTDNSAVRKYRTGISNYATTKSVYDYMFAEAYAKRIPIPQLGPLMGMTGAASEKQLEEYLATNPLTSDWSAKMANANMMDINKESIFMLARINYQLYQLNNNLEAIKLINAAQLQQAQTGINNQTIDELRQRAYKSVQN